MTDRCPHCGQKMRQYVGGAAYETVKSTIDTSDKAEWTMDAIIATTGLERGKAVYNAVNYLVKIGRLKRTYRGVFRVQQKS